MKMTTEYHKVLLKIEEGTFREIKTEAIEMGMSMNDLINKVVGKYLKKERVKKVKKVKVKVIE